MGDVIVTLRILPEDMEKFESIKEKLEELKPQKLEEEPIAFGLKAVKFVKIIPDEEGYMDKLEDDVKKVEGVQSVEVVEITRSL